MEAKIDILFYLFGTCMLLWLIRTSISLKRILFPRINEWFTRRLSNWSANGDYQSILENVDSMMAMYPGDADFMWAKVRALFKVGKRDEALVLLTQISQGEPLWKEDAEKYISSINAHFQSDTK